MATLIVRSVRIGAFRQLRHVQAASIAPTFSTLAASRDPIAASCPIEFLTPRAPLQLSHVARYLSSNKHPSNDNEPAETEVKLSLFQRFKQMYRDYWYVLVPVHLVTSAAWFGSFYYMVKSGIDVVAIMESYNVSERITNPLKDSSLGYVAISYAMYKIATPLRYTVTLGGTTISINYLQKWGYIKPMPNRDKLREIYKEKKDTIIDSMKDKREELRMRREQLKDRTDNLIGDMEKKIITKINDSKKKSTTTNTIQKH